MRKFELGRQLMTDEDGDRLIAEEAEKEAREIADAAKNGNGSAKNIIELLSPYFHSLMENSYNRSPMSNVPLCGDCGKPPGNHKWDCSVKKLFAVQKALAGWKTPQRKKRR